MADSIHGRKTATLPTEMVPPTTKMTNKETYEYHSKNCIHHSDGTTVTFDKDGLTAQGYFDGGIETGEVKIPWTEILKIQKKYQNQRNTHENNKRQKER